MLKLLPNTKKEQYQHQLINAFELLHPVSPALQLRLLHYVRLNTYPRGYFLEIPGEANKHIFVLLKGIARSYTVNSNNKEITTRLLAENRFINLEKENNHLPLAVVYTELLERAVVAQIAINDYVFLGREFPEINCFKTAAEKILEQEKTIREEITICNISVARYARFAEQHPLWLNRFPGKYIAGYLGMAPETLSRIKQQVYKKKK